MVSNLNAPQPDELSLTNHPPTRRPRWHLLRLLTVAAVLTVAGFRVATLFAVGACTNPYTVQPGDWIFKIALACGVSAQDIIAANGLANPNQIQPGQQLVLPGASTAVEQNVPSGEAAVQAAAPVVEAAVQSAPELIQAPAQPSVSTATTLVFGPVADAFVNARRPSEANGGSTILRTTWGSEVSYLAFDVAVPEGATVTGATLRVYVHGSSPTGFAVHASSADWSEGSLTHASAPAVGGLVGASGPHSAGRSLEVNLTGYITGSGRYGLVLVPLSEKPLAYSSREAGVGVPELVLQVGSGAPAPLPTAVPPLPTAVPPQPTDVPPQPTDVPPVEPTSVPPVEPTAVPPVVPTATQPPAPVPPQPVGNPLDCDVTNIAWSVDGQLLRGGRPDAGDVACLAAAGVDVLIDQRAPGEVDYDEAGAARAAGIEYINLGIPDDTAPSPATIRAWLDTVNSRLSEGKVVLVHDRAGRGRMGFWDAVFAMQRGASGQQAIEDRYIARAYGFEGAKIGCGDGGNGQVQALAEISAILTGSAYTPSTDEYGTRWSNCARPGYMNGWDYGSVLP